MGEGDEVGGVKVVESESCPSPCAGGVSSPRTGAEMVEVVEVVEIMGIVEVVGVVRIVSVVGIVLVVEVGGVVRIVRFVSVAGIALVVEVGGVVRVVKLMGVVGVVGVVETVVGVVGFDSMETLMWGGTGRFCAILFRGGLGEGRLGGVEWTTITSSLSSFGVDGGGDDWAERMGLEVG